MSPRIAVIIPARNEAALIGGTVEAALDAVAGLHGLPHAPHLAQSDAEVLVVDNLSDDGTAEVVRGYERSHGVRLLRCERLRAACARNHGARHTAADVLVFADADTLLPRDGLRRILEHCDAGAQAGITAFGSREGGRRAWLWWQLWGQIRRLPLPRAKAMPALMFCTRAAFERHGPFDEQVSIGEEWPILAEVYRRAPQTFVYDRALVALTSSRRMELQPLGYTRTLLRYAWAILHRSGRIDYPDTVRHRRHEGSRQKAEG